MTLLFVLSNPQSKPALKGLIGACDRAQVDFMCFFTKQVGKNAKKVNFDYKN